ncbi:MAG: SpoIIE family protein phosphatase, partial [Bacteroidetes bacterium]|nr:SpoIIE family protein phosphatase [Bacteroidota bacterium]
KKSMVLEYAGAYNPLYIIREGSLQETKADKQPIGAYITNDDFTNHEFQLKKGDTVYIFSDGYVDQFGGERDKKFLSKRFQELLLSIQDKSLEDQKEILDQTIEDWRGDNEQLDDICVIGIRV